MMRRFIWLAALARALAMRPDVAHWNGTRATLQQMLDAVPVHAQKRALVQLDAGGQVRVLRGDATDWHFKCFLERILPAAAARLDARHFPLYMILNGWDEPLGTVSPEARERCNRELGHLHANLWNRHETLEGVPVFSNGKVPGCHSDILIPHERMCATDDGFRHVPWSERVPRALWRGSPTGFGDGVPAIGRRISAIAGTLNHRVRWARLMRKRPDLFDAGMVSLAGHADISAERVPLSEWSAFKYIVLLCGNSYSGRSIVLAHSNATLLVASMYEDVVTTSLTPSVHMIRLAYDGSDAAQAVEWLQANDGEAERMGTALREYAEKHFSPEGLVEYTRQLLSDYSQAFTVV